MEQSALGSTLVPDQLHHFVDFSHVQVHQLVLVGVSFHYKVI